MGGPVFDARTAHLLAALDMFVSLLILIDVGLHLDIDCLRQQSLSPLSADLFQNCPWDLFWPLVVECDILFHERILLFWD